MAQLKIIDENGKERLHELIDTVTPVGRASANVIQVTDEKASRNHFRVEKAGERFKVVDLGSTNGTKLNGTKIKGEAFLNPGDKISLGKTTFTYDGPGGNGAAPPVADTLALNDARDEGGPKYVIKVIEGADAGKIYELGIRPLTIGRHTSNTIRVDDDATSNYHAEVGREPIGYVLMDLGSTNGTRVRHKNKTDFEKVVKTPLSVGMQIRVGKTLMEFENIGAPAADEAVFGTVALDADRLEEKLSEPSRGMPMGGLGALAALVFIGVVAAVVYLVKPGTLPNFTNNTNGTTPSNLQGNGKVATADDGENKITNGDFSLGTDDEGNPRHFKVERGAPGVKCEVVPEADRSPKVEAPEGQPGKSAPARMGVRINKAGKSAAALTAVETFTSFAVDPGKVYEFSGWMRNDGDGLFGLRVTWIQGDRKFTENPVVLKDTQEWKEKKSLPLTPPPWAQRAQAGIFVQGKEGKASFDDLVFREKPRAAPAQPALVKVGLVGITFEGTKGFFTGTLGGERVIEDGSLMLVSPDGSAVSDLASAIEPQAKYNTISASFDGRIYDFALQELTNYRIQTQQGAGTVDLKAAVDSAQDNASAPRLSFRLVGAPALGDVEVFKPGNAAPEKILATDGPKSLQGISELLFNAGKTPQLDLTFPAPADVEIKREGNRRSVVISFKAEVQVGFAPESMGQKMQMLQALDDLRKAVRAGEWGDAEAKLKAFRIAYSSRFPQARLECGVQQGTIDDAWSKMNYDVRTAIAVVQQAPTEQALKVFKDIIAKNKQTWGNNPDRTSALDTVQAQVEAIVQAAAGDKTEQEAEALYRQAETYFANKVYSVSFSILTVKLINDPIYSKTKAAVKARDLLPKVEAARTRQDELAAITERLKGKTRNYIETKDYKGAIEAIEKDKEYLDNKDDLPDIKERLTEWRKKIQ